MFEGLRVLKESSSIRKAAGISQDVIKKAFENNPRQIMSRLAQNKKISVSTVFRMGKQMEGKNLRRSRKPLLSAAMVQKSLEKSIHLLNDGKNHENWILIYSEKKTFTVDSVPNKQNEWVVTFKNDVSEQWKVSTTKHKASIMMLCIVSSKVWFKGGYRLTSAVYKEVLETKVLTWVKKITKKSDYVFQ